MSSETQYIELYKESAKLLYEHSCEVMNLPRETAMQDFERLGFPTRKVERYKYTDVETAFAPNFGLNLQQLNFSVDPYKAYRCSVPNIGTALYYMVNEQFYAAPKAKGVLPESVYVGSLRAYSLAHPEEIKKYYGKLAATKDDALTALNTALAQDGLLIFVPDGVKVEQTLQIVNLMRGEMELMTNRRTLIIVGKKAEVSILFCEHTLDKSRFLTTSVTEVFLGAESNLNLYGVDETAQGSSLFENFYLQQDADSHLEYAAITLQADLIRRQADFMFVGPNSDAHVMGAVVAGGTEHVDNNLLIDHRIGKCKSDVLYKYVLDGEAVGAFAGKVLVRKDAQKTDSQETNANLCVSPAARMFTQPMLEIYADDVKCNHGSNVGQINETALFYMGQRGIPPEEARMLLQHAFVNEVISKIRLQPLRERLSMMVEGRFRHQLNACTDCGLCK